MYRTILVVCPAILVAGWTYFALCLTLGAGALYLWGLNDPPPRFATLIHWMYWAHYGVPVLAGVVCGIWRWNATVPRPQPNP